MHSSPTHVQHRSAEIMAPNASNADEWDRLRHQILRLYSDEARPLKEIVEIMRLKYNFHATPRMYKYRLQKWSLWKKYKEKEVVHMSLLKQQRDIAGKQSVFFLQGRRVDWGDIERYLHRRPDLEMKIKLGMLTTSTLNSNIVCRSPSPDPILHASSVHQSTDELLRLLRGYYHSDHHDIAKRSHPGHAGDYSTTIHCYTSLAQARTLIIANNMKPGFQALNKSLNYLRSIIEDQEATLLFFLCDVIVVFDQRYKALIFELLRHIHDTLSVMFGDGHPLCSLLHRLIRLSEKDRHEVIAIILRAALDNLKTLSISDHMVERLNCHYILLLEHMGITGKMTKELVPEIDVDTMGAAGMSYLGRFAEKLILNHDFEEADRKTDIMLAWLGSPLNQQHAAWADLRLFSNRLKAYIEFSKSNYVVD
ncbi:uncharacterized protein FMAN_14567 [Fusarium mangiferae]|uniref:Clr5 domain-containing protein n=1 Tax=Fusarium mangiferae TaxID=192010 RepID=A0A1L7UB89_FUSMA|nr:uncharacterized protein FMAN_14567 [Fusarium mangiferae]CVL07689.1 uncharacterized protein FMAN_14567 [Fusarium mangiferae]